jgi:hypothetical protein
MALHDDRIMNMDRRYEQESFSYAELAAGLAAGGIATAAVVLVAFLAFQRISRPLDRTAFSPPNATRPPETASPEPSNQAGQLVTPTALASGVPPVPDSSADNPSNSSAAGRKEAPVVIRAEAAPAVVIKPQAPAMSGAPTPLIGPVAPFRTRDEFAAQTPQPEGEVPMPPPRAAMRDPSSRADALWIQTRLRDLGYYSGSVNGVWGSASRRALLDFKTMNGLPDGDGWDRETEQAVSSRQSVGAQGTFIGIWAKGIDACQISRGAVLVIRPHGAKTDRGKCDFHSVKRETPTTWQIQANCSAEERVWRANISLKLTASSLHWTSERGNQTYVRCPKS